MSGAVKSYRKSAFVLLLPGPKSTGGCSTESQQLTRAPSNPTGFTNSIENFTLQPDGALRQLLAPQATDLHRPDPGWEQKTVKNANVAELIEADCFGPGAGSRQSQVFIRHKSLFLLQIYLPKSPNYENWWHESWQKYLGDSWCKEIWLQKHFNFLGLKSHSELAQLSFW